MHSYCNVLQLLNIHHSRFNRIYYRFILLSRRRTSYTRNALFTIALSQVRSDNHYLSGQSDMSLLPQPLASARPGAIRLDLGRSAVSYRLHPRPQGCAL